jgi:tetratricopeptide (TPR) repeat protein
VSSLDANISETIDKLEQEVIKGNTRVNYYSKIKKAMLEIIDSQDSSQEERIRTMLLLGRVEEQNNQTESALSYFNQAVEESSKIQNLSLLFQAYHRRTFFHRHNYNHEEMLEDMDKTTNVYESLKLEKNKDFRKEELYYRELAAQVEFVKAFLGQQVSDKYFETVLPLIFELFELAEELNDPEQKTKLLNHLTYFHLRMGNYEGSLKYAQKMVDHANKIGNKYRVIRGYYYFISYYAAKGNSEKKLEYYHKIFEISKSLGDKDLIAEHDGNMGYHYFSEYKYDLAIEHLEKYHNNFKAAEGNFDFEVAECSRVLGMVHRAMGNLDKALDFLLPAYTFFTEKKPENWWYILPALASVYLLKGELDKALELQEEQLELQTKMEFIPLIALTLRSIGEILWQKGLKKEALEKAIEGWKITQKTDNKVVAFNFLVSIIYYLTELNEVSKAEEYFEQIKVIISDIDYKGAKYLIRYVEALILRKSNNTKDRHKAEFIFEDLLKEELNYSFHIYLILAYTELLITNIQTSGDQASLIKLLKFSSHLFSLATANKSHILTVEALLLQSKLALLELDTKRAQQLKEQALKIAEENNLDRLKNLIIEEQKEFDQETDRLHKLDKNSSLTLRIEKIDFSKRINGVKKAAVTQEQVVTQETSSKLFSIKI